MTPKQVSFVNEAIKCIKQTREWLDMAMYFSGKMPEEEFKRIREAYDLVCKANDKL